MASIPLRPTDALQDDLLEGLSLVAVQIDPATLRFLGVSRGAERLLGHPLKDWKDPAFVTLNLLASDRNALQETLRQVAATGRPQELIFSVLAVDGRSVEVRARFGPGKNRGTIAGVLLPVFRGSAVTQSAGSTEETHLRFYQAMDRVNRFIQGTTDPDRLLEDVLDLLVALFDCDRACMLAPTDRAISGINRHVERCRSPLTPIVPDSEPLVLGDELRSIFRQTLAASGPVVVGDTPGAIAPVPTWLADQHGDRTLLLMAIHPALGDSCLFGLHQCGRPRVWTPDEARLFQAIGQRLGDSLSALRLRQAKEESEARYLILEENASDALFFLDQDCRVIDVNRRACESLGYTREQLIGALPTMFDPDMTEKSLAAIRDHRQLETIASFDTRHRRKDGTTFPVEIRARVDRRGGGYVAVCVVRDITERKRVEEALLRSNSLLHSIFDSASDAVFVKDLDGRYLMANGSAAENLGRTVDQVIGRTDEDLFSASNAAVIRANDRLAILTGRPATLESQLEIGGQLRTFVTTKSVFRDADGRVAGLVGIARDVSEERRLESELRQAQKMEAVGRLAGGIAHNFNNMLTVIESYTEMVLEDLGPDDPHRDSLREVLAAAERNARLTRQLVSFSRKQPLRPSLVEINGLLREFLRMVRSLISADIELLLALDRAPISVRVDADEFQQAMLNLALNARDAMPQGGTLRVATEATRLDAEAAALLELPAGNYALISLSDTGTGMSEAVAARIFEPFFTTKSPGDGTGLGLSMVYGFVRQSGGAITVDSTPGLGSTFRVYLPASTETAPVA